MNINFTKNFKEDDISKEKNESDSSESESDDPDDIPEKSQNRVNKLMIRN